MDLVSIIVYTIAAAAVGRKAEAGVQHAYAGFKALLRRKYGSVDVRPIEVTPTSQAKRDSVAEDLKAAGAERDAELLKAASQLLRLIQRHASNAGSGIGVDLDRLTTAALRIQEVESEGTGVRLRDSAFEGDIEIGSVRSAEYTNPLAAAPNTNPTEDAEDPLSAPPTGDTVPPLAPPDLRPTRDVPPPERRINVWTAERASVPASPLVRGERYTLCINVGRPVVASVVEGPKAEVPDEDIPEDGLATEWVLHSHSAELEPLTPDVQVTRHEGGDTPAWTARFALRVPRGADSDTVRMACTPLTAEDVRLRTMVYVRSPVRVQQAEPYRDLDIELWVVEPRTYGRARTAAESGTVSDAAVRVVDEAMLSPTAHLNLGTTHEWTTPGNVLSITVLGPNSAMVKGGVATLSIDHETGWPAVLSTVSGPIANLRAALERFRGRYEGYLEAVPQVDLERRLARLQPGADFVGQGEAPGLEAQAAWDAVSRSAELRELALEGRALYDKFFPPGSELRGWIDQMQLHDRLDVNCQPRAGTAFVPHVPWGLMYRARLPSLGKSVDPMGFLGMALRLGYSAHKIPVPSKALGRVEDVTRAFFFYWGDQAKDPTGVEARWQRGRWAPGPRMVVVPDPSDSAPPKQRLLSLLEAPVPAPTALLYLYCQCKTGQGNDPVLRFGSNAQSENVVRRVELGGSTFTDRPLVFANACTTSSADPFLANELETRFFDRGARAYLGTEGKVPISLASRFAAVFFHYFDRKASAKPMAAGEAVYQARLFFWHHYRNLGGLFYTYVNQYELYMADDAEVRTLQS